MSAYKHCPKCGNPMAVGAMCETCKTQDGWIRPGSNPGGIKATCFPAGTKILTPDGSKPIETLNSEDAVFCWSKMRGERSIGKVLCRKVHAPALTTHVIFDDGHSLTTTRSHSLLTDRGWIKVSSLRLGDVVATDVGQSLVRRIADSDEPEVLYNLITWPENTFIAEGVIVHNFTYFRVPRSAFWRLREWINRNAPRYGRITKVGATALRQT